MLEGGSVSLLHKPVWLDGWGDAASAKCFRTEKKVWKSFCREWKRMANRPLGRAKWPAVVQGHLQEVAPTYLQGCVISLRLLSAAWVEAWTKQV